MRDIDTVPLTCDDIENYMNPGFTLYLSTADDAMIYGFIQIMYLVIFAALFEKKGFRWNWFLPLAAAFAGATLLTALMAGRGLPPLLASGGVEDRVYLLAVPMYILFIPIHAFITVGVMKHLPANAPVFDRLFARVLVYIAAAMAAGFVFSMLAMAGMVLFQLIMLK
jgi:hypothetical protein